LIGLAGAGSLATTNREGLAILFADGSDLVSAIDAQDMAAEDACNFASGYGVVEHGRCAALDGAV
jgi:hypothetical protein